MPDLESLPDLASGFEELVRAAAPVTEDHTVVDFAMPRYAGSGFGSGLMMWVTGRAPAGTKLGREARLRHYLGMHRSVVPYLRNVGAEGAAAIEARIDARRSIPPSSDYPLSEESWVRLRSASAHDGAKPAEGGTQGVTTPPESSYPERAPDGSEVSRPLRQGSG